MISIFFEDLRDKKKIKREGHGIGERELLDEIFELALQNDMNYLG